MSHEAYCRIAHPQMITGTCPGCQQVFGEGQDHRWDISRMEADVDGGDPYTLEVTTWNLEYSPPEISSGWVWGWLPSRSRRMWVLQKSSGTWHNA